MRLLEWIRDRCDGLQTLMQFDDWPFLILQRCFFQYPVIYRKGGVRFLMDRSGDDHAGLIDCVSRDVYFRHFPLLPRSHPLQVLDLGANSGGFGLALLLKGFEIERIVAVEMNLRTYARLVFNLTNNLGPRAVILNAAVCQQSGSLPVADNFGNVSNSIYDSQKNGTGTVTVPAVTLDELTEMYFPSGRIDILKMDIEFAEYEIIFSQTSQTIVRYDYLLIEIHEDNTHFEGALIERLKLLGFEILAGRGMRSYDVYLFGNRRLHMR
jgi:FkbM family methyltransferase